MNYKAAAAFVFLAVQLSACGAANQQDEVQAQEVQTELVKNIMADAAAGAAEKQIAAYEAAKKGSSQMQICLEAMGVTETYRAMDNEEGVSKWEPIQHEECEPVGMNPDY